MTSLIVDYGSDREPVVLPPGAGGTRHVPGAPWTIKLTGADTAGGLAVLESVFAPGEGAPLHLHRGHDEAFYVASGEFLFRCDDRRIEVGPGGFRYLPRGHAHGFRTIGDQPGTLLGILTPAGFENFFIEAATLFAGRPNPAQIQAVLDRYDQVILEP